MMAQLLPPTQAPAIDPEFALKVAQSAQEMLRRDFYSAAFVIMGAAIVGLVAWVIWLQQRVSSVQELRVKDFRETAVALDRNTESVTLLLAETQARAKRRRADDPKGPQ